MLAAERGPGRRAVAKQAKDSHERVVVARQAGLVPDSPNDTPFAQEIECNLQPREANFRDRVVVFDPF